jgi:hypothetical protein
VCDGTAMFSILMIEEMKFDKESTPPKKIKTIRGFKFETR